MLRFFAVRRLTEPGPDCGFQARQGRLPPDAGCGDPAEPSASFAACVRFSPLGGACFSHTPVIRIYSPNQQSLSSYTQRRDHVMGGAKRWAGSCPRRRPRRTMAAVPKPEAPMTSQEEMTKPAGRVGFVIRHWDLIGNWRLVIGHSSRGLSPRRSEAIGGVSPERPLCLFCVHLCLSAVQATNRKGRVKDPPL